LTVDFLDKQTEIYSIESDNIEAVEGIEFEDYNQNKKKLVFTSPEIDNINAIREELYQFSLSVQHNTPPIVSLKDAQKALQVGLDIVKIISKFS
jgi:hypothetical protein